MVENSGYNLIITLLFACKKYEKLIWTKLITT